MPKCMPGGGGLRRQTWVEAAYNVLSNPLPLHLAVFVAHLCACAVSIAAAVSDELSTAAAVSDELSTLVCTAVAPLTGAWAGPAAPAPGVVARAVAQQLGLGLSRCGRSLLASGRLVQLMVMACAVQCVGAVDPVGDDDAGAAAAVAVTLSALASVVAGAVLADASRQGGAGPLASVAAASSQDQRHANTSSTAVADVEEALYICLANMCLRGGREGDIRWLLRAARVSRAWLNAVHASLPLVPGITFPAHVTGADVLAMLIRLAGANLKTVCLEGCRQLSAVDIGRVLADLAARCPAVIEVNLTDCEEEAILRALAVCSQKTLGAVSLADFRALLLAQAEEADASRCPLARLLERLCLPRLLLDADFAPGRDALRKAVECAIKDAAAVYDVLLLLLLTFHPAGQDETITFDSNQQFGGRKRALHLVAEAGAEEWKDGGPAPLVSVLTLAGTDVNATDGVSVWRERGERACV